MILKYPPVLQVLVSCIVAWLCTKALPGMSFEAEGATQTAIVFCIVGLAVTLVAVRSFFTAATTVNPMKPDQADKLVTTGWYKISRNPMYVGLLMMVIGYALWLQNPSAFIGVVLFVFTITIFQIKPEEKVMEEKFGDEYTAYKTRVRRWL